ncbi:hypothetical protein NE857_31435 [Nocardiopsis exhalans]|uniref:Transcriptional regulator n=1 Tax=Nocardiopsis exhalans TaxID=163604 RepID=A0ABY5D963_9ACTN|nr:hypothetical protein [Nocardiopsis exhalans]USY19692.1 hypothetical protein NE857_31435 [Nocardiopsis exhalans]
MSNDLTGALSYAPVPPPEGWEIHLARATTALYAPDDRADRRSLLEALGLDEEAGPRVRLATLTHRPDRELKRAPGAPTATAPPSEAVLRSRAAAAARRREALADYYRAQGLHGTALRSKLARMGAA